MNKKIGLIGDNSLEYIEKIIDIWNNNDCAVIIDYRIPINSAINMLNVCNVDECYIEESLINNIPKTNNFPINYFRVKSSSTFELPLRLYKKYKANYTKDDAVILFSSGTTGNAKGIVLSFFAINTNSDLTYDYLKLDENDIFYIVKSLSHSSTLICEFLVCIKQNIPLIVSRTNLIFKNIFHTINKYRISIICLNPSLLYIFYKELNKSSEEIFKFESLKKIYVSGSCLSNALINNIRKKLDSTKVFNVYGMTETGPRIAAQRKQYCNGNSVGIPLPNIQVKIINNNLRCKKNEIGTIYVNTPCGYTKYISDEFKRVKNWINTKDLGYFDNSGELYIIGREDDVIITGSHKVFPSFIEDIIIEHEKINECIVIGINDEYLGEKIVCFYVSDNLLNTVDLINHCKQKLASYEIPAEWHFKKELIKNSNGKIDRNYIKRSLLQK